jgi:hypothetical protein
MSTADMLAELLRLPAEERPRLALELIRRSTPEQNPAPQTRGIPRSIAAVLKTLDSPTR